jgi:chromosome partitioning protein
VRTFAIVNQKGGCGKTTTAINLSAVFARRGLRTLLVDMDPQSHCAIGLGVPEQRIEMGVAEALVRAGSDELDPAAAIWEVGGNLSLLPSTIRLAGLEAPGGGLHELPDRDRRLARLLGRLGSRYDRCIIDCPPTIGLLTFNALRAAREAIIPVETGFFALRGADRQWRTIRQLVERIGRPIACHIVPTLHRPDSTLAEDILGALRRQFAGQVVPVVVHEDEVVREAASFGQPVIEYAPQSQARQDFDLLADWLEDHPPQPVVEVELLRDTAWRPAEATVLPALVTAPPGEGRAAELVRRVRALHESSQPPAPSSPATASLGAAPPGDTAPPGDPALGPSPDAPAQPECLYGAFPTGAGVRFVQPGDARKAIFVAGDFNHWSATAHPLAFDERLGAHQLVMELPPGRYSYRLVVDGRWAADPYNPERHVNDYGEPNSLVVVARPGDRA